MEDHELEGLRRSVVMLPPGHSSGALSKAQAERLLWEIESLRQTNRRYHSLIGELRRLVDQLDALGEKPPA